MFAAPSSLARMWASAPPMRVNFRGVLSFASASAFRAMMEVMMSAFTTPMTSGASPYNVSMRIVYVYEVRPKRTALILSNQTLTSPVVSPKSSRRRAAICVLTLGEPTRCIAT